MTVVVPQTDISVPRTRAHHARVGLVLGGVMLVAALVVLGVVPRRPLSERLGRTAVISGLALVGSLLFVFVRSARSPLDRLTASSSEVRLALLGRPRELSWSPIGDIAATQRLGGRLTVLRLSYGASPHVVRVLLWKSEIETDPGLRDWLAEIAAHTKDC